MFRVRAAILASVFAIGLAGCSSARKKTVPELSRMEGRKVALVSLEGEPTSRSIVEVALVNRLIERGSFVVVSKQDVEKARTAPDLNPTDWKNLARRAGAEIALRARVAEFDATEREGYSTVEENDSQLAAELGRPASEVKTTRAYKVRSLHGRVRVDLEFTDLTTDDTRTAPAEAEDTIAAESKDTAGHLPPKLRFLERLSNEAFKRFFAQYN